MPKNDGDKPVLVERQKWILSAMLWEEARNALGGPDTPEDELGDMRQYVRRIDKWLAEDNGVDRENSIQLDEVNWPEVKRVETLCTTISDNDNSPATMEHLIVFEDLCVRLRLRFPQYGDDECDGSISVLELHQAAEADAVWEEVRQSFVNDCVFMAMRRLPAEGFDRVLRAAAEMQSNTMTPQPSPCTPR